MDNIKIGSNLISLLVKSSHESLWTAWTIFVTNLRDFFRRYSESTVWQNVDSVSSVKVFGRGFLITISFFTISVYSSFYIAVFFPVGFLRILISLGSITLDNITVSFLTTSVYSSFYLPVFFPVGFLRNRNSLGSITLDNITVSFLTTSVYP